MQKIEQRKTHLEFKAKTINQSERTVQPHMDQRVRKHMQPTSGRAGACMPDQRAHWAVTLPKHKRNGGLARSAELLVWPNQAELH
jgi:hypothetical protein